MYVQVTTFYLKVTCTNELGLIFTYCCDRDRVLTILRLKLPLFEWCNTVTLSEQPNPTHQSTQSSISSKTKLA